MPPAMDADGERLAALAEAARDGDATAFGELVVATYPRIHALVLRLVGDEHDAGDVVQETYLRAFRSIGSFRSEAAVTTWLYRIAANCSSTHLKRRRSHDVLPADLPVADPGAARAEEVAASGADDRSRLVAALDALPPSLRSVVVLHDVYDLPHEAIAAELEISRAASRVRLHRARRRLREALFPRPAPTRPQAPSRPAPLRQMSPSAGGRAGSVVRAARGTRAV